MVTAQKREQRLQEVPIAIRRCPPRPWEARYGDPADVHNSSRAQRQRVSGFFGHGFTQHAWPSTDPTDHQDGGVGLYIEASHCTAPVRRYRYRRSGRVEVLRGRRVRSTAEQYGRSDQHHHEEAGRRSRWSASVRFGSRNYVRALADIDLPRIGDFAIRQQSFTPIGTVGEEPRRIQLSRFGQRTMAVRWTPSDAVTVDYAGSRRVLDSALLRQS